MKAVRYFVLLWFVLVATNAFANPVERRNTSSGQVDHIVIAWLKQPGNKTARREFVRITKSFADLPGVLSHDVGEVLPGERKVVDSSFDVAAVIRFKDKASLMAYLKHPKHKEAVKKLLKPLVKKLVVYDIYLK